MKTTAAEDLLIEEDTFRKNTELISIDLSKCHLENIGRSQIISILFFFKIKS